MSIYILKSGEKRGPFTVQQVVAAIKSGEFLMTDLAWTEGPSEWKPLHSIAEVVESALPPVPIPPHPEATTSPTPQMPKVVKSFFIYWGLLALAGFIILWQQVFSFDWFFYAATILITSFVVVAVFGAMLHSLPDDENSKPVSEAPPIPTKLQIPSIIFGGVCMVVGVVLVLLAFLFGMSGLFVDKSSPQEPKSNFMGAIFIFAVGAGAFEIGRKALKAGKG